MLHAMRGKHAMVSFEHPRQIEAAAEICQSLVLDNGAFSAWSAGREYNFAGYREWATFWVRHPAVEWCVIPDVIDGDEARNDALLEEWSLPDTVSVPVFHLHETLARLERLIARYPRVALGSSAQYADPGTRQWWGRMAEVMEVACDSEGMPRTKLHGLRMLDPVIFSHLPLSTADSCSVSRNVGIDIRWSGPYVPRSQSVRAMVLIDRIELHASAWRWSKSSAGIQQNMELLG